MVKTNKKGMIKRLAVFIVAFLQLMTVFTPLVAYADDGDDKDKVGEVDKAYREGNVYSEGNTLIGGAFETSATYDPYVHYVTTYNTLMSRAGDLSKSSPYAMVYKGEQGEAVNGSGSKIKDKYGEKDTSAMAIIDQLEGIDEEDSDKSGDTAIDAGQESPNGQKDPEKLQQEIESLRNAIAEDITNNIYAVLKQRLALDESGLAVKHHGYKGHGYNEGDGFFGGDPLKRDAVGSGYVTLTNVKNNLKEVTSNTEADDLYKEKLKASIRLAVDNQRIGLSKSDSVFSDTSDLGGIIADAEDEFAKEYSKRGVITARTTITKDGSKNLTNGGYWNELPGEVSSWSNDNTVYLIRVAGYKKADVEEARKFTATEGVAFISRRFMWNYGKFPVDRDAIGTEIVNAYNSAIGDKSTQLQGLINANEIQVPENVRTLAWTPIYPTIVDENVKLKDGAETMQKIDARMSISGNTFTFGGETRTLQGMDLFVEPKTYSPVLIGNQGTIKNSGRVDGTVSRLNVGSTSGGITSGDKLTSRYVWYSPSTNGSKAKQDLLSYKHDEDLSKGDYVLGLYTRYATNYDGNFSKDTVATTSTLGVDNYGNMINGETGDVILPYWQNHMFKDVGLNDTYFPHSPLMASYGEIFEDNIEVDALVIAGEASADDIKTFVGGDNALYKDAIKVKTAIEGENTPTDVQGLMESGVSGMSKDATARGLAALIATSTSESVKGWNKAMLADAKSGSELYVSFSPLLIDKGLEDALEDQRWTAASMIQRIGWIMDYGFSDLIRLTVVSNLTRTYNTTIAEAGLESIFYTNTITNSEGWDSMTILISTVIGAVLMGYLLLVGFKAYRGDISWSNVIMKAIVLSGVMFYPMFVYGNLVEYGINKPTTWIMGNQMRLSVVLDTYFAEQNTKRSVNQFYENMFGKYADSDALQLGSYNVTFYTTTDKQGFDINTTNPEDSSLSIIQSKRLERYQNGMSEYPKNQLVSVSVPLTDLYKWVWDVRYNGEGMEHDTYGKNSPVPEYDDVVGEGHVEPLFRWLAKGGSSYFGVEGYQDELASYEEYKIMPQELSPLDDNQIHEDVTEMRANSTYGAGFNDVWSQTGRAKHLVTEDLIESTLGLEVLSGSELYYDIIKNSSDGDIDKNLSSLEDLSKMKIVPLMATNNAYIPSDDDMRALVRDLSNTSRGREYWYGESPDTPARERWSNFTRATFKNGETGSTGGTFIGIDGVERRLVHEPELIPPKEDFLGLTGVVKKYTPNRSELNPYKRTRIEEDVSDINTGLLNNYLSTYSITKMSLGADGGRDKEALNHAEKMVMATEAFFQFNKALGWNHFPQTYEVDSIKFDKYLSLVYIPFKDYGQPTMTFFEDSEVIPMSTAEHIAMGDSIWDYAFFMVAVVALVMFGMLYIAVLYFGLLIFSMYNFIYYYVIKSDYQNKSALGSMVIMFIMSLSKMALMLVIWACSWIMNKNIATSPLNLPSYPVTFVHSLAILLSVGAIFLFVIKPTWRGVMGDKENMGGQFFADKVQDLSKAVSTGAMMPGRGKGVSGGSQASKFSKGNKRTGNDMKNNAGRLGNMDEKGLSKARKQAGSIGGTFGVGGGQGLASSTKRRVGQVKDALRNTRDKAKGIDRSGRKFVDPTKVKASNLVERRQLNNLGKKMNGLVQTASGLGMVAVQSAVVGQELANFKTGMITTMALGSAGAASVVAKNLLEKGIQARTDGNNVLFDSSGYDLEDASVRSELFNNSVSDLQDQNVLKHANVQKGKVDGSTAVNYDYSRGDSRLGLALDDKKGVHTETFNQLANTQEFKDLFIAPRPEELTYDRKGNIIGIPEGGLRLVNPQMSVTEVQNKMNKLYETDNKLREENNLNLRDQSDKSGINIDGMDENYYNQNIAPLIKDQKGMYTQGSRIVYDKMNINHNQALREVNNKVDEYNKNVEKGYGQESNNLMRYVVNNGDNQGIVTETVNGDDNKVLATMVHGSSNYKQNVSKYKVDENEIGQVGDNVEAVSNLRDVALKDKKLSNTVNEFTNTKKDLRNLLSSEVKDMTANDRVMYNQEMLGYLDTTQVSNTPEFKTVKANIHDIQQRYKQNELSETQYHDLVRRENENLTNIMDSTGKLDGFILNRYDTNTNPYIKKYEEQELAKSKSTKKAHKTLKDRYNASVDKLDKKVGRKNLMEMPLGVIESTVAKNGEEYQLDGKGVLVQRTDARRKRNSLDGKDKDAVMSYLMKRPLDIQDVRNRKMASK